MSKIKSILALGLSALLMSTTLASLAFAELPSDVTNVQAFPGDGQITVSWDPATDDTEVSGYFVYYGLSSVAEEGGAYTFGSEDVGDTTSYTFEELSNGITYYFAVTAYDNEDEQSEFYSDEAEATPEASETGDFTEPTVSSASAMTSTLVEVTFSEAIELPLDAATAFSVEATDGTPLEVVDAYLSEDPEVVFLVTEEQEAGTDYILTAGIEIMDLNGNPIVSGTSDTAVFTGSGVLAVESPEETDPEEDPFLNDTEANDEFVLDDVEATDINELTLTFSQNVMEASPEAFTIELLEDASETVEVLAVSIDSEEPTMVTLVTAEMEAGFDYLLSMDETVLNEDSESLATDERSLEFTAPTLDPC